MRFALMLVLQFPKSRDVTSLLKWIYRYASFFQGCRFKNTIVDEYFVVAPWQQKQKTGLQLPDTKA